jgi:hypothetical protein
MQMEIFYHQQNTSVNVQDRKTAHDYNAEFADPNVARYD